MAKAYIILKVEEEDSESLFREMRERGEVVLAAEIVEPPQKKIIKALLSSVPYAEE